MHRLCCFILFLSPLLKEPEVTINFRIVKQITQIKLSITDYIAVCNNTNSYKLLCLKITYASVRQHTLKQKMNKVLADTNQLKFTK